MHIYNRRLKNAQTNALIVTRTHIARARTLSNTNVYIYAKRLGSQLCQCLRVYKHMHVHTYACTYLHECRRISKHVMCRYNI